MAADYPLVVSHLEKDHPGIDVIDPAWRQHPEMAHAADHRAHGTAHGRFRDDDRAQMTLSAEVLNEICEVLGFMSLGREHVRQNWHLAPDATARRLLGLLRD